MHLKLTTLLNSHSQKVLQSFNKSMATRISIVEEGLILLEANQVAPIFLCIRPTEVCTLQLRRSISLLQHLQFIVLGKL